MKRIDRAKRRALISRRASCLVVRNRAMVADMNRTDDGTNHNFNDRSSANPHVIPDGAYVGNHVTSSPLDAARDRDTKDLKVGDTVLVEAKIASIVVGDAGPDLILSAMDPAVPGGVPTNLRISAKQTAKKPL